MGPITIPTAQPTPDPFASLPHSPSGLSMSSQPIQMQVPVTPIQQIQIPPQIQVPINQPPQIIQQPPQIIRPPQPIIQPPPMIAPPVSQGFHQGFSLTLKKSRFSKKQGLIPKITTKYFNKYT